MLSLTSDFKSGEGRCLSSMARRFTGLGAILTDRRLSTLVDSIDSIAFSLKEAEGLAFD